MPISFIPTSTFGRYGLKQLYQSRNTYLAVQLLNVPTGATGDRSTWTWASNWSNYIVAGAYSGSGGSLDLSTTIPPNAILPPSEITLYEEATSLFPGAYYAGEYVNDGMYVRFYNNSANTIQFTHAAFFAMQSNTASLNTASNLNESLLLVIPYAVDETATQLTAFDYAFFPFSIEENLGGTAFSTADSFDTWVDLSEDWLISPSSDPFPFSGYPGYHQNKQISPYVEDAYKNLLGITPTTPATSFLAELLNVTGAEPDFEDGWNGWSTYRINRYSTATLTPQFNYTSKTKSYTYITYEFTWTGLQIALRNSVEFIITPPSSSSFTFTHIAVFINEASSPPPAGTTYTYTDTDKFIGVIKLPSSVTMTTSSVNRAYPFNFSFMYQPTVSLS